MYVKAYQERYKYKQYYQPQHYFRGSRNGYYWLDRDRDYPTDTDRKTVMVLGTLGVGKSTVLNKLSQSELEPFRADM